MTRRSIVLALLPAVSRAEPSRNKLAIAANAFTRQYAVWAEKMNSHLETLDAGAVAAWQPLPELWRKVERASSDWLRGY